jgi:hypothetical protein
MLNLDVNGLDQAVVFIHMRIPEAFWLQSYLSISEWIKINDVRVIDFGGPVWLIDYEFCIFRQTYNAASSLSAA